MISYGKVTKAQYEALTPVQDRIYYITDTGEQFLNGLPYNGEDRRDYLCLTARQASTTVSLDKSNASMSDLDLEYSTDRRNWTKYAWNPSTGAGTTITLSALGDKVYFRGDNTTFTSSSSNRFSFTITGKADPSGNIMSLLDKTCELKEIPDTGGRMFYMLFGSASQTDTIVDASGLRLPATTLAAYCYGSLFAGQTGLTTANFELPAVTMKDNCYRGMFNGCQSLTLPPELPSTILATGCYSMMFRMCNALVKAPKLPATTLAQDCYDSMFFDCNALSQVEVSFTDWQSSYAPTDNWLTGVSATGVFKCPSTLDTTTRDASHVPAGWTIVRTDASEALLVPTNGVVGQVLTKTATGQEWADAQGGGDVPDATDYLCFIAETAGAKIRLDRVAVGYAPNPDIEFSTDKKTWTACTFSDTTGSPTVTLSNIGDKVWYRGTNTGSFKDNKFVITDGYMVASGNVMSLIDKTCRTLTINEGQYFNQLFQNCTNITMPPKLPATTLSTYCYYQTFNGCTNLREAPALPATTLKSYCYNGMFSGCTSLVKAPELPATSLASNCYNGMFSGCTSLVKAPELPATSTEGMCYWDMFKGASNLKYMNVALTRFTGAEGYWLENVSSIGIFECPSSLNIATRGEHTVPTGWTIVRTDNPTVSGTALNVDTTSNSTVELSPSGEVAKHITVSSALTLSASASASTQIAYAEVVIDLEANATVTAGTNLTLVDTPTAGKRNVCVVRWSGGAAKLYVTIVEDLPQA